MQIIEFLFKSVFRIVGIVMISTILYMWFGGENPPIYIWFTVFAFSVVVFGL
jgi:hypothetical protein